MYLYFVPVIFIAIICGTINNINKMAYINIYTSDSGNYFDSETIQENNTEKTYINDVQYYDNFKPKFNFIHWLLYGVDNQNNTEKTYINDPEYDDILKPKFKFVHWLIII